MDRKIVLITNMVIYLACVILKLFTVSNAGVDSISVRCNGVWETYRWVQGSFNFAHWACSIQPLAVDKKKSLTDVGDLKYLLFFHIFIYYFALLIYSKL